MIKMAQVLGSLVYICDYYKPFLQVTLSQAMGIKGEVKKTRTLILVGQTRVHIDDVEGLGQFMELEVSSRGQKVVPALLITCSYWIRFGDI